MGSKGYPYFANFPKNAGFRFNWYFPVSLDLPKNDFSGERGVTPPTTPLATALSTPVKARRSNFVREKKTAERIVFEYHLKSLERPAIQELDVAG